MSYILEALKKSEKQRELGGVPTLHNIAHQNETAQHGHNRVIVIVAVVLLLVNLSFVGYWGLMSSKQTISSKEAGVSRGAFEDDIAIQSEESSSLVWNESAGTPSTRLPPAPSLAKMPLHSVSEYSGGDLSVQSLSTERTAPGVLKSASLPSYKVREFDLESELDALAEENVEWPSSSTTVAYRNDANVASSWRSEAQTSTQSEASLYDWGELPTVDELSIDVQNKLPAELSLTSHLYSSNKRYRSIILNGRFLKPSQSLNADIEVVEIVEQGVILSINDDYFRIFIEQ